MLLTNLDISPFTYQKRKVTSEIILSNTDHLKRRNYDEENKHKRKTNILQDQK